ncbi:unnamed protein product [Protopolystoma xenopodis]|uniref:Uncharacterized protein n=1 Tax=Protopolystoma xenopodis TaxID=117903 RepID=A0A3S5A0H2_9PLAT|nr:unnamed protein product [Protopolystoma xenopodis]
MRPECDDEPAMPLSDCVVLTTAICPSCSHPSLTCASSQTKRRPVDRLSDTRLMPRRLRLGGASADRGHDELVEAEILSFGSLVDGSFVKAGLVATLGLQATIVKRDHVALATQAEHTIR